MPNPDPSSDPDTESTDPEAEPGQPEEPLNRAERRARRRGRKPAPPPSAGKGSWPGHQEQVVVPRRSGRRGNR